MEELEGIDVILDLHGGHIEGERVIDDLLQRVLLDILTEETLGDLKGDLLKTHVLDMLEERLRKRLDHFRYVKAAVGGETFHYCLVEGSQRGFLIGTVIFHNAMNESINSCKGHGLFDMRADLHGRGVVGENSDGYGLVPCAHLFIDRLHDTVIEIFDRFHLQLQITIMAGLIGSLKMEVNEVLMTEGVDGGLRLALVVRIGEASSAGDFNDVEA